MGCAISWYWPKGCLVLQPPRACPERPRNCMWTAAATRAALLANIDKDAERKGLKSTSRVNSHQPSTLRLSGHIRGLNAQSLQPTACGACGPASRWGHLSCAFVSVLWVWTRQTPGLQTQSPAGTWPWPACACWGLQVEDAVRVHRAAHKYKPAPDSSHSPVQMPWRLGSARSKLHRGIDD